MNNHKKIIILGLGVSGQAALKLAIQKGLSVLAVDENNTPEVTAIKEQYEQKNVSINPEWKENKFPDADLIVISPGIDKKSQLGKIATHSGIPIISELEFGFYYSRCPILAVTGTNGKTTVTELTTHLLNAAGRKAEAAGNIGVSLSEAAINSEALDFLVVEVSSFQLERCHYFAPCSAALLNVSSDHIDRHLNFTDYSKTKFRIFKNITSQEHMIIRRDLLEAWRSFTDKRDKPVTFSASDSNADFYLSEGKTVSLRTNGKIQPLLNLAETRLPGLHNAENIMASLALVFSVIPSPPLQIIKKAICEFRTGQHRLELIMKSNGIRYIDDSKATNPDALIAALRSVGKKKNICLIAGGLDKKMDFSAVLNEADKIKSIFLVGECKKKLATLWEGAINCVIYDSFEDAVLAACSKAESGDVVLLSPGCASMDMFKDYKERGEKFKNLIKRRIIK